MLGCGNLEIILPDLYQPQAVEFPLVIPTVSYSTVRHCGTSVLWKPNFAYSQGAGKDSKVLSARCSIPGGVQEEVGWGSLV